VFVEFGTVLIGLGRICIFVGFRVVEGGCGGVEGGCGVVEGGCGVVEVGVAIGGWLLGGDVLADGDLLLEQLLLFVESEESFLLLLELHYKLIAHQSTH